MAKLEDIKPGAKLEGLIPNISAEIVSVDMVGNQAINVVFRVTNGNISETTLFRDDEHRLNLAEGGRNYSFEADGALVRLVTEANRIKLAHFLIPIWPYIPVW